MRVTSRDEEIRVSGNISVPGLGTVMMTIPTNELLYSELVDPNSIQEEQRDIEFKIDQTPFERFMWN